ncbi:MAG: response regulator transcription factor [Lentisphaeraceae bacterium]|nr:response regulator transcription factor [Lentisphaeraceae bacterium]
MKVLVVEDDKKISEFLVQGLKDASWSVDAVGNGKEGLISLSRNTYDVVITDIMMPEMTGLEMIEEMRSSANMTPVLILSAKDTVDDRVQGLKNGGDDYLVKPFALSELLVRLEVLVRRTDNERFIYCGELTLDTKERTVQRSGTVIDLQPKEYALLEYLVKRQDKLVTRKMIVENVWNYSFVPSTNIVDSRLCRLRKKVDGDFEHSMIQTVRGGGYTITAEA